VHEVEVKVRAGDTLLEPVLLALGAVAGRTVTQEDTYYQHPHRDFARSDEALRVRHSGDRFELTYKGPRSGGNVKSRVEFTHELDNDPAALLQALGFVPAAGVRKTRMSWQVGDVTVALDDVAGLGRFVEVEVVAKDPTGAAAQIESVLSSLGLNDRPRIVESYVELQLRA